MPGQQQRQRDQQDALAHQRDEQRAGWFSDALKEGGRCHVHTVQEECHHVEPEAVGRTVQIERVVGHEERGDLPGKQQVYQPP